MTTVAEHIALLETGSNDERAQSLDVLWTSNVLLTPKILTTLLLETDGHAFDMTMAFIKEDFYLVEDVETQIRRIEVYLDMYREAKPCKVKYETIREAHFIFVLKVAKPIQIGPDVKFPGEPWAIAVLNMRVAEIAKRKGFRLEEWEEDGLGLIKGFSLILPTGLWVFLREPEHLIKHGIYRGPHIEVSANRHDDVDDLLNEVLEAFDLNHSHVQSKRINVDDWS